MAKRAGVRTALAPGRHWDSTQVCLPYIKYYHRGKVSHAQHHALDSTQVCRWFDAANGTPIDPRVVLRAHAMAQKVQARLAAVAAGMPVEMARHSDIRSYKKEAEAYVEGNAHCRRYFHAILTLMNAIPTLMNATLTPIHAI